MVGSALASLRCKGRRRRPDLDKAWDDRMRLDLAERYDSRRNMIDWDYHMGLGDLGPLVKFPGVASPQTRVSGRVCQDGSGISLLLWSQQVDSDHDLEFPRRLR